MFTAYNAIIVVEGNTGRDRNKRRHWPKTASNGVVFVRTYFPEGCLYCQLNFEIITIPDVVRYGWRTLLIAVTRRPFIGVHVRQTQTGKFASIILGKCFFFLLKMTSSLFYTVQYYQKY